jgi:hypothetical protein
MKNQTRGESPLSETPCSEIVRIPVRLGYGDNWIGTLEITAKSAREIGAMAIGLKSAPQANLVIEADTKMIREIAFGWPPHSPNVRVDAPAVGSSNSTCRLFAGCISRLVRFLHYLIIQVRSKEFL